MVRRGEQMLHFVVRVYHIRLSSVNIVAQLLNARILALNLRVEVLRLVLGGLDYANHLVKLVILVPNHLLLVLKNLAIVKIACLVIFTIFAPFVLDLLLLGCQGRLVALDGSVLLGQLALDDIVDLLDEPNATRDLLLADAGVLVRLVLIIVHQLVKVAQVGLESGPGGLHEVLGAGHGLTGLGVADLFDLIAKPLDTLLGVPIILLKLISTHILFFILKKLLLLIIRYI